MLLGLVRYMLARGRKKKHITDPCRDPCRDPFRDPCQCRWEPPVRRWGFGSRWKTLAKSSDLEAVLWYRNTWAGGES